MQFQDSSEPVRLDKWLWAARFYKTRSLATEAISGGKVHVDGDRVKPSKKVGLGAKLEITQGEFVTIVTVKRLLEKRGPASVALTMYEETEESRVKREALQQHQKYTRMGLQSEGRPDKKGRRQIRRMKYGD
ncbi:MAG: S4 domain-containing protein [Gammaproteobacteria bacterium]|nr:S4 domain-containing protein [Gammaproteobacteria bacterium]